MYCVKHENLKSVEHCSICGAAICKDCNQKTKEVLELDEPLCIDCAHGVINEMQIPSDHNLRYAIKQLIISAILFVVGIIFVISGFVTSNVIVTIVGLLICGLRVGLFTWKSMVKDQQDNPQTYVKYTARQTYDDKIEVKSETCEETNYLGIVIGSAFAAVLGSILMPIAIIYQIYLVHAAKKEVEISNEKRLSLCRFTVEMDLREIAPKT